MGVTLAATGRIAIPYTIDGLNHVLHHFVRNPQLVGTVWQVNSRTTDSNDTLWSDVADGISENLTWVLPASGLTMGAQLLQTLVAGIWTTQASHTYGGTNHASGSFYHGWELSVALITKLFHPFRISVMEGNQTGLDHSTDPTAGPTVLDNFISNYLSTGALSNRPYVYVVGRDDQYLNTSPFRSYTISTNRRVRRKRGLT